MEQWRPAFIITQYNYVSTSLYNLKSKNVWKHLSHIHKLIVKQALSVAHARLGLHKNAQTVLVHFQWPSNSLWSPTFCAWTLSKDDQRVVEYLDAMHSFFNTIAVIVIHLPHAARCTLKLIVS